MEGTGVINFYELEDVQRLTKRHHNPNYNSHTMPLKHPMRCLIVGASGSGKSNCLLNIINLMNDTFERILIFTQDKEEPLYKFLEVKIPSDMLTIFEGIDNVKQYDFDNLTGQTLCVFDDMCVEKEKDQQKICELFIRGRKMAHEDGISLIYLTQSFYQTPILIRKQLNCLIIIKLNGKKDIQLIMRDCAVGASKEQLLRMYEEVCDDDINNFLFIDLAAPASRRFRLRFNTIIDINDFGS